LCETEPGEGLPPIPIAPLNTDIRGLGSRGSLFLWQTRSQSETGS